MQYPYDKTTYIITYLHKIYLEDGIEYFFPEGR